VTLLRKPFSTDVLLHEARALLPATAQPEGGTADRDKVPGL
jgi:hypothetical protein